MRIITRLRTTAAVTAAASLLLSPVFIWAAIAFNDAKNDYLLANVIQEKFFERASFRDQYFLYREDRVRTLWDNNKEESDDLIHQAKAQFQHPQDRQNLEQLQAAIEDTAQLFHRVVANSEMLTKATSNRPVYEELDKRLYSQLLLKATIVRDTAAALEHHSAQRIEQAYWHLTVILSLFGLILALAAIQTSLQISRLIHRRLIPLHQGAKAVADGDLHHRIVFTGEDEFTELARSINAMTDSLQVSTMDLKIEIMQRERAEEALSEMNRDFVALLDNSSDFIYYKDENSRFRFCSQTLATITGHAHWRDMIGKHDLEVFPKDTAQTYHEEDELIFHEGKPLLNKIAPYYDAAGNLGWISTNKWPVLNPQGRVIGLFGISRDITAFRQAQEALQQSESRFRQMFERNDAVMLLIKPDTGEILDANAAASRFYGYPPEQLKTMKIGQINMLPPDKLAEELELTKLHQRNFFIFPHLLAHGDVRTVEVRSSPIEIGHDVVVFSIISDITERRRTEEKLRLAASVFSHAHEGIMITATDGAIIDTNKAFTRITGYHHNEVLGKNPRILNSGHHAKEFYATLWNDLRQKGYWSGEMWNRRKSGEIYAEMQTISAVRDTRGNTQHYVALFSDITDRKKMEDQIQQMAFYDPLTHLPNRRLLTDRLTQAMAASARSGDYGAMLFLDLDNFKALNDNHGHEWGDLLLIQSANRLETCVREMDTVARFGGDEFVVILSALETSKTASTAQAGRIAEKIRIALSQPYVLTVKNENGVQTTVEHHCTASIGVALFFNHEISQEDILKQADSAMYQAKEAGRNTVRFYDATQGRD